MAPTLINMDSVSKDMRCFCSTPDDSLHEVYDDYDHDGRNIILCTKCGTERREIDDTVFDDDEEVTVNTNQEFEAGVSSNVISSSSEAKKKLKGGDEVAWGRQKASGTSNLKYNHHAIVVSIDDHEMRVIHYARSKGETKFTIKETVFRLDDSDEMGYGDFFCINYPSNLIKLNPPTTVINRARSSVGKGGYSLLFKNCETFAKYCKTGSGRSVQVSERFSKVIKTVMNSMKPLCTLPRIVTFTLTAMGAEGIEAALGVLTGTVANIIGAAVFIFTEGVLCCIDLYKLYGARRDNSLTKKKFKQLFIKRIKVSLAKMVAGFAGSFGGSMAGRLIGGAIGSAVGGAVGNVPGATVGMGVGQMIGGFVGGVSGGVGAVVTVQGIRTITWSLRNREKVDSILQLALGDHVVLPGERLGHPYCHAIISGLDNDNDKIKVIRNDHKRGVVEDWIAYVPMQKMKYGIGECYPVPEVLKNARSCMGVKKYSLAFYNCKTFAVQQKRRKEVNF